MRLKGWQLYASVIREGIRLPYKAAKLEQGGGVNAIEGEKNKTKNVHKALIGLFINESSRAT